MKKLNAMSTMGYAIVCVIILGIIMIVSAPMLVNDVNSKKTPHNDNYKTYEAPKQAEPENYYNNNVTNSEEYRELENRLMSRINDLEEQLQNNNSNANYQQTHEMRTNDNYMCSVEGVVDNNGNVSPISGPYLLQSQKIVFVCEYKP